MNRGRSVGIVTGLQARRPAFDSRQELEVFLLATVSRPALGPNQPPIQWVPVVLVLWVKLRGREADHSPPSSASTSSVRLHGVLPSSVRGQLCPYTFILVTETGSKDVNVLQFRIR
jgi:hypothetical protein